MSNLTFGSCCNCGQPILTKPRIAHEHNNFADCFEAMKKGNETLEATNRILALRVEAMEGALKKYAKKKNWRNDGMHAGEKVWLGGESVDEDGYLLARAALAARETAGEG